MKLSYDPQYNVAYLRLHEKAEQVTTIKVSDEMSIDIAPDGTVYGIELLAARGTRVLDSRAVEEMGDPAVVGLEGGSEGRRAG